MTQLMTKEIVQETFDTIVETLVREGRIELRNFGVFEAKERAARRARNPRTGVRVDVPAKIVVTFKPGKKMEDMVRNMDPVVLSSDKPEAATESLESSPAMEEQSSEEPPESYG
jgi:nucleoid DNA-binding protein